tara:strand:+ start:347 stop:574 length:228 start_codon:yes stop_codon:yes gene_type:complete
MFKLKASYILAISKMVGSAIGCVDAVDDEQTENDNKNDKEFYDMFNTKYPSIKDDEDLQKKFENRSYSFSTLNKK